MTDPTGVPHPYEAGMKRIRDYNEGYAAHKALKPMLLRPLGGEAREAQLMEVNTLPFNLSVSSYLAFGRLYPFSFLCLVLSHMRMSSNDSVFT